MAIHHVEPDRVPAPAPGMAVVDTAALDAAVADPRTGLPSWLAPRLKERIALLRAGPRRVGQEAEGIDDLRALPGVLAAALRA